MIRQSQNTVQNTDIKLDWPPLPPSLQGDDVSGWYESLKGVIQNAINSVATNAGIQKNQPASALATIQNLKKQK